jgi:PTS system N-acetylglucosamine-specific IIC component
VPIGIASGLIGGVFYNRFSTFKLPEYLAFFSGRRFVPIISGMAGLLIAVLIGFGYDGINGVVDGASRAIVGSGEMGLLVYGFLNRILIVTGLHHILNNIAWFVIGDYHGATGDLRRFFADDPSAGGFMSGFFPVMMFGLPAACLAMYHTARPEKKKAVGGMLTSLALTSFLTGVTEPIEFSFMFLAPLLYAVHAVLTGVAMAVMNALDIKLGFTFSAGLFDYVLNFGKATHPLWLLPLGALYAGVYYGLFRFFIVKFDLKTPGREADDDITVEAATTGGGRGADFVAALGGAANLVSVDACTTRLRLIVVDQGAVSEPALKALGARGVVKPSDKALQVVLGPIADGVAGEIRAAMAGGAPAAARGQARRRALQGRRPADRRRRQPGRGPGVGPGRHGQCRGGRGLLQPPAAGGARQRPRGRGGAGGPGLARRGPGGRARRARGAGPRRRADRRSGALLGRERLHQIAVRAGLHRHDDAVQATLAGQHQDRHVGACVNRPQGPDKLNPVGRRQPHVHHEQGWRL